MGNESVRFRWCWFLEEVLLLLLPLFLTISWSILLGVYSSSSTRRTTIPWELDMWWCYSYLRVSSTLNWSIPFPRSDINPPDPKKGSFLHLIFSFLLLIDIHTYIYVPNSTRRSMVLSVKGVKTTVSTIIHSRWKISTAKKKGVSTGGVHCACWWGWRDEPFFLLRLPLSWTLDNYIKGLGMSMMRCYLWVSTFSDFVSEQRERNFSKTCHVKH